LEIAVLIFSINSPLFSNRHNPPQIPGKINDRRTPLGELTWIFNAITDTIAYRTLAAPLFRFLFRQDLLVAALFRNFLLAGRVMKMYGVNVRSEPAINPEAFDHPLWDGWDFALDMCLTQLP
jgi:regulator-associated protein of mTOR